MIVATINPISHSRPVHHGTFFNVLIEKFLVCKHRQIIICAHNYFRNNTQTKQHIVLNYNQVYFLFIEIWYFIQLAINTHIDCANNKKLVFGSFSKQQQGALKVCCASFSVISSELQNTSSGECVEPEPVPDSEDLLQLDSTSVSSQDTLTEFCPRYTYE